MGRERKRGEGREERGRKGEGEESWILSAEISKSVPGLFQLLASAADLRWPFQGSRGGDFLSG